MDRDAMQRVIDQAERRAAAAERLEEYRQGQHDESDDGDDSLPTSPRELADLILGR